MATVAKFVGRKPHGEAGKGRKRREEARAGGHTSTTVRVTAALARSGAGRRVILLVRHGGRSGCSGRSGGCRGSCHTAR